jgi:hypothetical protein
MNKLVQSVSVNSVADLWLQFQRFAKLVEDDVNPFLGITRYIPRSATYYVIVPERETELAEVIMKRLAGRKKLRRFAVDKDEINSAAFAPTKKMVVFYV